MTNRKVRQTSSAGRIKTSARTTLFWPDVLLGFADWLIESGWAEDSMGAYSVVFALDRSLNERGYFVYGNTLPLGIFELDEYVDRGRAPCADADVVDAIGLFAMFAVSKNLSPSQRQEIYDFAEAMVPDSPRPATPVQERQFTTLGGFALTAHIQKLAEWSITREHVPAACLENPEESVDVARALGLHVCGNCGDCECGFLPATINYGVIVDAALSVGVIVQRDGQELRAGPGAAAWSTSPTTDQLRESLVAAYQSCLAPAMDDAPESLVFNIAAAATLTTTMLIRSLVDDPFSDSEGLCIGPPLNSEVVAAFSKIRLVSMIDLGLMVAVNNRFCIPDVLAPFLIEALDRDRRKRQDHG